MSFVARRVAAPGLPQYVVCVEDGTPGPVAGLGLALELRAGYRFDFPVLGQARFLNAQFFGGWRALNPKPASFVDVDGGDWYWSPVPMPLLGLRL